MDAWQKMIGDWEKSSNSAEIKAKAIEGLKELRKYFPKIEEHHPLLHNCHSFMPQGAMSIEYTKNLILFFKKEAKDFNLIIKTLTNPQLYLSKFLELELKYLLSLKFPTILDVKVKEKECDIVIKVWDRLVYGEITHLGPSQANRRINKIIEGVSFYKLRNHPDYRIKIESLGKETTLKDIEEQLTKQKKEFDKLDYTKQHLLIDGGKIKIAQGRLDASVMGPPPVLDQYKILERRIQKEIAQLDKNSPNVIFIYTYEFLFLQFGEERTKEYIERIETLLKKYPTVSAIYILSKYQGTAFGKAKKKKISQSYSILLDVKQNLSSFAADLIINPKAKFKLIDKEKTNLKNMFKI